MGVVSFPLDLSQKSQDLYDYSKKDFLARIDYPVIDYIMAA